MKKTAPNSGTALRLLAGVSCAMLLAAPMSAQQALPQLSDKDKEELYCVYEDLSDSGDAYDVVDILVDGNASKEDLNDAYNMIDEASERCSKKYNWTEKAKKLAGEIGMHGAVVDVLTEDLSADGVKDAQIDGIFDILDSLPDADIGKFKSDGWSNDTAFTGRATKALVAAGLEDKGDNINYALLVMQATVLALEETDEWRGLLANETGKSMPAPSTASRRGGSRTSSSGRELAATGTGWYVTPTGYLLTNNHVVEDCARMTLASGKPLEVVDADPHEDLALLKDDSDRTPPALQIRDGRQLRLAEDVLVAGYPLGGILASGINITTGSVSALMGPGDDRRRFQFTAPVQPGNSGGPLLDMSGNVVGVVVSKLNAVNVAKETGDIPQNVNFGIALPSVLSFLNANHVAYQQRVSAAAMDKVDLADLARQSTVLLQCYK